MVFSSGSRIGAKGGPTCTYIHIGDHSLGLYSGCVEIRDIKYIEQGRAKGYISLSCLYSFSSSAAV